MDAKVTHSIMRDKVALEVEQCSGFKRRNGEIEYPCSAAKSEADRILAIIWAQINGMACTCHNCLTALFT